MIRVFSEATTLLDKGFIGGALMAQWLMGAGMMIVGTRVLRHNDSIYGTGSLIAIIISGDGC